MTEALIALAAVVTALALIIGIHRISMWLTNRKSSKDFKKERPDATSINDGGFMF